ncbi:hypothetical protein C2E23DRAFT_800859 [Lenzites betulinus]|nr:hypothetical protein C2E23DRAFT_800859 [Lenzites betulinus]
MKHALHALLHPRPAPSAASPRCTLHAAHRHHMQSCAESQIQTPRCPRRAHTHPYTIHTHVLLPCGKSKYTHTLPVAPRPRARTTSAATFHGNMCTRDSVHQARALGLARRGALCKHGSDARIGEDRRGVYLHHVPSPTTALPTERCILSRPPAATRPPPTSACGMVLTGLLGPSARAATPRAAQLAHGLHTCACGLGTAHDPGTLDRHGGRAQRLEDVLTECVLPLLCAAGSAASPFISPSQLRADGQAAPGSDRPAWRRKRGFMSARG